MKKYQDTYELYKDVFDEVHASEELLRKVDNMSKVTAGKNRIIKKGAVIAVAAAALMIGSNAAVYAATGSTWVEQIVVHTIINGEEQDLNIEKTTDKNGDVQYQMQLDDDDKKQGFNFILNGDEQLNNGDTLNINNTMVRLSEENEKIYLEIPELDIKEDITEDFADGKAKVTCTDENGAEIVITVEGTVDDGYSISYYVEDGTVDEFSTSYSVK